MELPTLADRAWYAYHCLPRDRAGKLPTLKDLELANKLSYGTLSHVMKGRRSQHHWETFPRMASALHVSEAWLRGEADTRGPTLTGMLPPRPGTKWSRHADVPGWKESVALVMMDKRLAHSVPPGAFLAGADLPVFRPLDRITPPIALAAAAYAYETATREEQRKYTSAHSRSANAGHVIAAPKRLLRKA